MNARRVEHVEGSQALGERFTVTLIPKVGQDLRVLQERTSLSRTDLMNRAITLYQFVDDQLRTGHDIIARDRATGEKQLVKLLTAPERQAAARGLADTGGGRAGRARWWPKGRHWRQLPVPSRPRKPTVPRRARLPVLACGFRYLAWLVLEVRS